MRTVKNSIQQCEWAVVFMKNFYISHQGSFWPTEDFVFLDFPLVVQEFETPLRNDCSHYGSSVIMHKSSKCPFEEIERW